MTPNDTLMEQCRREAKEAWLSCPDVPKYTEPLAWMKGYAAALFHERTKPRTSLSVEELAQQIRIVDGNHSLGAGALAEALMPFLTAKRNELNTQING